MIASCLTTWRCARRLRTGRNPTCAGTERDSAARLEVFCASAAHPSRRARTCNPARPALQAIRLHFVVYVACDTVQISTPWEAMRRNKCKHLELKIRPGGCRKWPSTAVPCMLRSKCIAAQRKSSSPKLCVIKLLVSSSWLVPYPIVANSLRLLPSLGGTTRHCRLVEAWPSQLRPGRLQVCRQPDEGKSLRLRGGHSIGIWYRKASGSK